MTAFYFLLTYATGLFVGWCIFAPTRSKGYVVRYKDVYLSSTEDIEGRWVDTPADAFPFSSYDLAESAALGVGGRVEVLPEAKHTPPRV